MKKLLWISIITILFFLVFKVSYFFCEIGVKCGDCDFENYSIQESKQKGYFKYKYLPIYPVHKLKNYNQTIIFKEVFSENAWGINADNCFDKFEEKRAGFNFIIEFDKSIKDVYLFSMLPIIDGEPETYYAGISEHYKTAQFDVLLDTIWFQLYERSDVEDEKILGDKIGFVKVIENN